MTLEQTLKQKRIDKKLTQGKLAKKLSLESPQFVSNIERGLCGWPVAMFPLLKKLLGVSVKEMIDMRGEDYKAQMTKQLRGKRGGRKASVDSGGLIF